jgi:hypothetical protein
MHTVPLYAVRAELYTRNVYFRSLKRMPLREPVHLALFTEGPF